MVLFYFIFIVLMIAYAVLITYYHREWNRIPVFDIPGKASINSVSRSEHFDKESGFLYVSVVIAMRNESKNIAGLLQSLKAQDYATAFTEIILIDDHSTDDTWQLINNNLQPGYISAIRLQELPGNLNASYKKQAISAGIGIATGELIITTDADCTFHPQWLSVIVASHQQTGSVFIAAPVRFKTNNSFLSIFETLDFITLQGITGASVASKFHTMCNGANLAYTREAFREADGFAGIDHIPSGDDMLLMYKIFRKHPDKVTYLKASEAIVDTPGAHSVRGFFNQRIRWSSKAVHYDDKRIFRVLVTVYFVNISFLVAGIASFWKTN
ncbi:MAG: glycosyltransferase, partial [Chitinophagaceae bacterium]